MTKLCCIALILLQVAPGQAAEPRAMASPRPPQCNAQRANCQAQETKLKAAARLITAQDLSIKNLKQANTKLINKIEELSSPPLLPVWMWYGGIFILGAYIGSRL